MDTLVSSLLSLQQKPLKAKPKVCNFWVRGPGERKTMEEKKLHEGKQEIQRKGQARK